MTIHHIYMDHIRSRFFDSPHLFPETAEISGQNGRRNLFHVNLCRFESWAGAEAPYMSQY
jgi:hypothetical protein